MDFLLALEGYVFLNLMAKVRKGQRKGQGKGEGVTIGCQRKYV